MCAQMVSPISILITKACLFAYLSRDFLCFLFGIIVSMKLFKEFMAFFDLNNKHGTYVLQNEWLLSVVTCEGIFGQFLSFYYNNFHMGLWLGTFLIRCML